jgi:hypothetical protein
MQSNEAATNNVSRFAEAFCKFAGCKENEIKIGMQNGHAIVFHNGITYKVSTYETLSMDFEEMFELREYNRISSEIQEIVWIELIQHMEDLSTADFILSLYKEWSLYWQAKEVEINDEKAYNKLRDESWKQLIILIETIKMSRTFASINGSKLDPCFVPIVALALRQQYEFIDHFCDELIDIMTEAGLDNLSFGDTYQVVFVGGERGEEFEEQYYIYNPPDPSGL